LRPLGEKTAWTKVHGRALGPRVAQYGCSSPSSAADDHLRGGAVAVLYYFGVMQVIVRFFAWLITR